MLLSELYTLLHYHHYDKFEDMVVRIPVWKEYLERISLSFISKIFCSSVLYSGSTITKEQIWGKLISKKFSLFLEIRYYFTFNNGRGYDCYLIIIEKFIYSELSNFKLNLARCLSFASMINFVHLHT